MLRSVDKQTYLHIYICIHYSKTLYELNSTLSDIFLVFHTKVYLFRNSKIFMSVTMCGCLHKRAKKYIYEAQIYSMHNMTIYLVRFSINVSLHGYINMYAEQFQAWKAGHIKNILHFIFPITSI